MSKRRSLWGFVLPLALTVGVTGAYAQDEDPPAAAPGGAAPEPPPPPPSPVIEGEASVGAEGEAAVGASVGTEPGPAMEASPLSVAPGVYTKETWPLELVKRPITLAKGMIEVKVDVLVNASKGAFAKPFSVSPDILFGVSDKLTVGLTHQTGLCLAGKDNGCAKVYDDAAVEAIYALTTGQLNVGAHVGLEIVGFDPMTAGIDIGIKGRYEAGKIGVAFDPQLYFGLNKRDFNKDQVTVPVQVAYQVTPKLAPFVITALLGNLDSFGDTFAVPVGFGALFALSNKLDVGGQFVFTNLLGKNSSADGRAIDLFVNFRL